MAEGIPCPSHAVILGVFVCSWSNNVSCPAQSKKPNDPEEHESPELLGEPSAPIRQPFKNLQTAAAEPRPVKHNSKDSAAAGVPAKDHAKGSASVPALAKRIANSKRKEAEQAAQALSEGAGKGKKHKAAPEEENTGSSRARNLDPGHLVC